MERKIGKIFRYNSDWYQCIEGVCGKDCSLYGNSLRKTIADITEQAFGVCNSNHRSDDKSVIFKKLEKVGEPYIAKNRSTGRTIHFQRYRCYQKPIIEGNIVWHWPDDNFIDIEIKQNKEDMKEKTIKIKKEDIKVGSKVIYLPSNRPYVITEANCRMKYDGDWHDCVIYTPLYDNPYKCFVRPIKDFAQNFVLDSAEEKEEEHSNLENTGKNLKPFDLEAAKAGKSVCTRDGRKARIICFDAKDTQPIIGLYEKDIDGIVREYLCSYHMDGRMYDNHDCGYDLVMLPEKKEGWVNVYYDNDTSSHRGCRFIYDTKEQAIKSAGEGYITTIKIEWEE